MVNQVVLIGRIAQIKENEKDAIINIAVPSNSKNENGEYDVDFIDCQLFNNVAQSTIEYCQKGDLIGIKGKLKSLEDKIIMSAERVTFLTSGYKKEEQEEE